MIQHMLGEIRFGGELFLTYLTLMFERRTIRML
jgi:hypothetical protein